MDAIWTLRTGIEAAVAGECQKMTGGFWRQGSTGQFFETNEDMVNICVDWQLSEKGGYKERTEESKKADEDGEEEEELPTAEEENKEKSNLKFEIRNSQGFSYIFSTDP